MGLFGVLDVSSAGLRVERTRLEVAAMNLANSRTTGSGDAEYKPLRVIAHSVEVSGAEALPESAALTMPQVVAIEAQDVSPHMVYDPGHPDADDKGFVRLPGVDPVSTMVDLASVSRGYEANLRVFDMTRSLIQRLLSIGGRS
jgi:flagellar basal-body rod protein FlgC